MNKNFKNTKAYRDYIRGTKIEDFNDSHHRGDEWSSYLYGQHVRHFYPADEGVPFNFKPDGEDE